MASENNVLSADCHALTDAAGGYITVADDPASPRITRGTPLTAPAPA